MATVRQHGRLDFPNKRGSVQIPYIKEKSFHPRLLFSKSRRAQFPPSDLKPVGQFPPQASLLGCTQQSCKGGVSPMILLPLIFRHRRNMLAGSEKPQDSLPSRVSGKEKKGRLESTKCMLGPRLLGELIIIPKEGKEL